MNKNKKMHILNFLNFSALSWILSFVFFLALLASFFFSFFFRWAKKNAIFMRRKLQKAVVLSAASAWAAAAAHLCRPTLPLSLSLSLPSLFPSPSCGCQLVCIRCRCQRRRLSVSAFRPAIDLANLMQIPWKRAREREWEFSDFCTMWTQLVVELEWPNFLCSCI